MVCSERKCWPQGDTRRQKLFPLRGNTSQSPLKHSPFFRKKKNTQRKGSVRSHSVCIQSLSIQQSTQYSLAAFRNNTEKDDILYNVQYDNNYVCSKSFGTLHLFQKLTYTTTVNIFTIHICTGSCQMSSINPLPPSYYLSFMLFVSSISLCVNFIVLSN